MELTEKQLIQRASRGDSDAFGSLMALHERVVYNLALRTTGNPDEAQDVAQEAFVRAWIALPNFRADSSFRTWIYRIVVNLCLNRFPSLRRDLNQLSEEDLADSPEPVSPFVDPVSHLENAEQRAQLHQAMKTLPESQRLMLTLRYQDEMPYEEIAALLNLPLGTIKTNLFRAKERLRQLLVASVEVKP